MSCIVLDIELADKNVIRALGISVDVNAQAYAFRPPQKYNPTKQAVWCTGNLHGIVWYSGRLDYNELSNILLRNVKGEYFAKRTEKSNILAIYCIKMWKVWKITVVPKFKVSLMKKFGFARVTHSDTRPHSIVQSVRQNCSVGG